MEARCMIRKRCEVYMTYLTDTQSQPSSFEEIPIVKDFPDIFSKELPGLPPIEKLNSQLI